MISTIEQEGGEGKRTAYQRRTPIETDGGRLDVIDLCCGLGGLSEAAKNLNMEILAGVDTSQCALKTFSKNFPTATPVPGSVGAAQIISRCQRIASKSAEKRGSRLVVVSGPPCQGFSMAGPRDPKDRRNKVLVAVAKAIVTLNPLCALVENVSMVLAEKNGERLTAFEEELGKGRYFVTSLVLDASEFGVPQKRKRAFFLVTKHSLDKQEVDRDIEFFHAKAKTTQEVLEGLPTPPARPDDYCDDHECDGIPNHIAMQHSAKVIEKIGKIEPGTGPMSYRRLHPPRLSNTLFSGHRAPPAHFCEPRSITVREAARLQGFPDSFRIYGSFANQMGQVTNAVPPPLSTVVLKVLLKHVRKDLRE